MQVCNVCLEQLDRSIYESSRPVSITSIVEVVNIDTSVFFCKNCGHLQSKSIGNLDDYYDQNYNLLINSEEEDQLYEVMDGKKVFRSEHQANTLLSKVKISNGAKILDYGCAKAATIRHLINKRTDIEPHLFDVSEAYIPFWENFINPNNWATYTVPKKWHGYFDLITSFFTLEHVEDPKQLIETIATLLKEDGNFYCIVPNVYANIADFIVVDHINHFSLDSIKYLFSKCGLEIQEFDEKSHIGAIIVIAKKSESKVVSQEKSVDQITELEIKVNKMSAYWRNFANQVKEFETLHRGKRAAIYGSGFYGTFIFTCLENAQTIECFIDQNSFLHGKKKYGKSIISPEQLEGDIELVYVGLNPIRAESIIQSINCWKDRKYQYFFPKESR